MGRPLYLVTHRRQLSYAHETGDDAAQQKETR